MTGFGKPVLLGGVIVAAAALLWLTSGGRAADHNISAAEIEAFPDRPITIVSWATPGGPTDLLARTISSIGPKYFGQRITVLTRQGGGGAVGMGYTARQRPDGYTLAINTSSGIISMAAGHIPFQPDDFTALIGIQSDPFVVVVRSDSPFRNLNDLFRFAHENPGRLSVAGFGTASAHFLAFESLKASAGNPNIRWIAYEGSGDANVSVLGGHTDAANTNYSVVREHLRAGTLRVLGSSVKLESLPEVRTYAEQGYDVAPMHWRGVMGPPGMPPALVAKVRDLLAQTINDPEFRQFMETTGNEYSTHTDPAEFQSWIKEDLDASRELMTRLNLVGRVSP